MCKNKVVKFCKWCNEEFKITSYENKIGKRTCCSRKCSFEYKKSLRPKSNCLNCNKVLFYYKSQKLRKYCNNTCRSDYAKKETQIKVQCSNCNLTEHVAKSRSESYLCCSKKCLSEYKINNSILNCKCFNCKKKFHRKQSHINRNIYNFCSKSCQNVYQSFRYKGVNNPNYRGDRISTNGGGYLINRTGDFKHRPVHKKIALEYLKLNNIPKGYNIHHRDCNKHNNHLDNLVLLTKSDHQWLHREFGNATLWAYYHNKITLEELLDWTKDKNKSKRLLTMTIQEQKETAIFKSCELLETLEADNQQPSLDRNVFEGSTTR